MKKIHKLSPQLIAQIAAGEVIERPSYAVKELIDNSIDAGANQISISLTDYGFKKIVVTDNGSGMSKEDLMDCWRIHTTSKISNSDSLIAIRSLGFRGEALASIASVSDLVIKSREKDSSGGHEVHIKNGKVLSESPIGMAVGTVIEVNNIFREVPARKKFLKSPTGEYRQIIDVFLSFALSYPNIRFKLTNNNKTIYDLSSVINKSERISEIVGAQFIHLLPILHDDSHIKFEGFLGKPQLSSKNVSKQYIYINGRRVFNKLITQALKDAYSTLLDTRSHPVGYIFLTIPYELVDVNVHPHKEQVAFFNNQLIYDSLFKGVKAFLENNNLTFSNLSFKRDEITDTLTGKILKSNTDIWEAQKRPLKIDYQNVSQLHDLYIFVPTSQGLMLFDQHACHERILFEQFKSEFKKMSKQSVLLPEPVVIKLNASEKLLVTEYLNGLQKIGLDINPEKNQIIRIPVLFKDRDLNELVHEVLEQLEEQEKVSEFDSASLAIIKYLSCKNAIKAGDKLTKDEMIELIKKLEKTLDNYTCPHGRPTKIEITLSELAKWFKRN